MGLQSQRHASGLPKILVDVTLRPGAIRELGDVMLPAPAVLEVELHTEDGKAIDRPELWLSRRGATSRDARRELPRVADLRRPKGHTYWRNRPLKAGDYRLHVNGRGLAPIVRDVRLVAGAPQRLKVTIPRGLVQEFIVVLADPVHGERGDGYGWLVFRDTRDRGLLRHHFQGPTPDPSRLVLRTRVHLLPGRYHVVASGRSGRAETSIEVREGGGPPVRIVLR